MPEIQLLRQLKEFHDCGTLSAAAENLHMTQPALTRAMHKLEEELGVSLFERRKNRILLNETGILAAEYAERILTLEEDMTQAIRNLDRSLHTLVIGSCAPGPLMEYPALLIGRDPTRSLRYEMNTEEALIEGLQNRQYQAVILSHKPEDPRFYAEACGDEHLYVSVSPADPIAAYANTGISFHDLDGTSFIMYARVGIWEDIVRREMPHSRLLRQDDLDAVSALLSTSSMPAFATDLTMRITGPSYRLGRIQVPFTDPSATVHYYCVCLREEKNKYTEIYHTLTQQRL